MTIPQLVAVLRADDRRILARQLGSSIAVWAGCVGPMAGKDGYSAADRWRGEIKRALGV
jgi:hypothetical protein